MRINGHNVSLVYCLLLDKSENAYTDDWVTDNSWLLTHAESRLSTSILDVNNAMPISGLANVVPLCHNSHLSIFFPSDQALWPQIQQQGLAERRNWLRPFDDLSFLQSDEVMNAFPVVSCQVHQTVARFWSLPTILATHTMIRRYPSPQTWNKS